MSRKVIVFWGNKLPTNLFVPNSVSIQICIPCTVKVVFKTNASRNSKYVDLSLRSLIG